MAGFSNRSRWRYPCAVLSVSTDSMLTSILVFFACFFSLPFNVIRFFPASASSSLISMSESLPFAPPSLWLTPVSELLTAAQDSLAWAWILVTSSKCRSGMVNKNITVKNFDLSSCYGSTIHFQRSVLFLVSLPFRIRDCCSKEKNNCIWAIGSIVD